MHINCKLNHHPKSRITIIFFLFLFGSSCKKNSIEKEKVEIKLTTVLSKSSPDYQQRLEAIKTTFYAKKLQEKLKGNVTNNLSWEPNWMSPSVQVVSDTVSYVLYPLIANLLREGKKLTAEELGSKSYLVIKNEKNFYYGMYYLPIDPSVAAPSSPPGKIEMKNFTGNLLLRNLEKKESFIIDYKNGFVSEVYNKKGADILKKVGSNRALLASIQTICHTEMSYCFYAPDSYNCNGSLALEFVLNCDKTPNSCGVTWYLVDHSEQQVCENVWFPDPPTGPEDNGGDSGASDERNYYEIQITEYDLVNATVVNDLKDKIRDIKKYTNCFNDGKTANSYTMTIYVDQPVSGQDNWFKVVVPKGGTNTNQFGVPTGIVFEGVNGNNFDVGHTFVTFEKNNTDGTNVRQTLGFYPNGNPFSSDGAFEDNSGHSADVSYAMNVTKAQFENALRKVESDFNNKKYILTNIKGNEYNCTDAGISWMNAGGANFGSSESGLFKNTPGSFGQLLRKKPGAYTNPTVGINSKGPCN